MSPMHFRNAMSSRSPALLVEGKAPPHFILSTEFFRYMESTVPLVASLISIYF
ncbi:hypothetical protein K439DRAFT_1642318, partial [Ramaria rubella]